MKKLTSSIAFLLVLFTVFFMCACTPKSGLNVPANISIDDTNTLSWGVVRNARSYRIEIVNVDSGEKVEDSTRRTFYELEYLAEGDYEIRLMAIGGNQNESKSPWSSGINFHKDYSTGLVYTLYNNDTEYMISKVGTAKGVVTIEDEYRGKPVTRIGASAFRGSGKLEGIVIGNNVKTIDDSAFFQCAQLASVTIPESVTQIGDSAFQGCNMLTQIKLPDSVTAISDKTFAYCRGLKSVDLGKGVEKIGETAFYSCSALEQVVFPDSVKSIGQYAFSGTGDMLLSSVEFGSGIAEIWPYAFCNLDELTRIVFKETEKLVIGAEAFSDCDSLVSVELPQGLTTLNNRVFYGCDSLSEVVLPESLEYVGYAVFNGTALYAEQEQSQEFGGLIYAGNWLVAATGDAKKTLPETLPADSMYFKDGVVGFAASSLSGVKKLRSITLPNSLMYINSNAMSNCPELYSLLTDRVNSNLKVIGSSAFSVCEHLSNIRLNSKLKEIGMNAFYNCASVTNNTSNPGWLVPDSVERIGQNAFVGTDLYNNPADDSGIIYAGNWVVGYTELPSSEIELSANVKGIADSAFRKCVDLRSISGLQRVEHIGEGAFSFCSNLTYIGSMNRYIEVIKPYTFYKCYSLFSVGFQQELKEIGFAAFAHCDSLNEIDLSETSVTTIGGAAFYQCVNVKELYLSDCVETIGEFAFYTLYQITEIELPDSLKEIGERAFSHCLQLQSIKFGNGLEKIGDFAFRYSFYDTHYEVKITIPDSVKYIGDYAFYNCHAITELNLGNGVEHIGMCAFYGLDNLVSLELPSSLNYIGDYAFMGCWMLRSVIIRGDIDYVGMHAFYGCRGITVYAECEKGANGKWSNMWNSSYRPVVWSVVFSEEGYVVSVTVDENTFTNIHSTSGFSAPFRKGYKFLGWSTDSNATEAEYEVGDIRTVESGTTLYAVWEEIPAQQEPDVPTGD